MEQKIIETDETIGFDTHIAFKNVGEEEDPAPIAEVAPPVEVIKSQAEAEADLNILLQAQKIRANSVRFMAAKAIAGRHYIQ